MTAPPQQIEFEEGLRGDSTETEEQPWEFDLLGSAYYFRIGNVGGVTGNEPPSSRKRGPKPNQRPAKNEKVERNRKAQRSHRERKERYIRNLEQEVIRLREAYAAVVKEKTSAIEENKQIIQENKKITEENKQLHATISRGAVVNSSASQVRGVPTQPSGGIGGIESSKVQYHQHQGYTHHSPAPHLPPPHPPIPLSQSLLPQPPHPLQPLQSGAFSLIHRISTEQYGQVAIDLVLALENYCLDHTQKLATRSTLDPQYIQGHVFMVTCPTGSHMLNNTGKEWGLKTVDLDPGPLATLFNMQVLDAQRKRYLEGLGGELTPMAAWTKITAHPRFSDLTLQDFASLTHVLSAKVECYGFGAVIEEGEVEEVLGMIFSVKDGGGLIKSDLSRWHN